MVPDTHVRRRKRQFQNDQTYHRPARTQAPYRKEDAKSKNCTICLHYNSMLYLNFMGPSEMIVIEQPWLQVVATFPEAVQRRVYGCN